MAKKAKKKPLEENNSQLKDEVNFQEEKIGVLNR